MSRSSIPVPRAYLVTLAAVSLVFVAAQLLLHSFFVQPFWGRYLDWKVYRETSGKYRENLEGAFVDPEGDAAFIIENTLLIDWAKSLTVRIPGDRVEPPWSLSLAVKREKVNVAIQWFEIRFSEGDEADYLLVIDTQEVGESGGHTGIYRERGGEREHVASLSVDVKEIARASLFEVRLDHDGRRLDFSVNAWKAPPLQTPHALNRPRIRFVTHPSCPVLIDDVRLEGVGVGGERRVLFEEDFDLIPLAVDLPSRAPWDTESRIFRTINLLAVLLVGLLLDLLFFRVFRSWVSRRPTGLLLAGLNGQIAILLVLRAAFSLPYGPTVLGGIVFVAAKSLMLFREAGSRGGPGEPADHPGTTRAGLPVWVNGAVLALICLHMFSDPSIQGRLAWHGAYTLGFFFLLGAALIAIPSMSRLALLCLTQYACFFLLSLFYPFMELSTYSAFAFLSIGLAMIAGIREAGTVRPGLSRVLVLGLCVLLPVGVELALRTTSMDSFLDFDRRVDNLFWKLDEDTALFGQKDEGEIFLANLGREYTRVKGPGVFRIICLGSSSTAGGGASDWKLYSYPPQLEERLREQGAHPIEVLNVGKWGYTFYQLMIYSNELLLPIGPDMVVLYFGFNRNNPYHLTYYEMVRTEVERAPHLRNQRELEAALSLRWNPRWLVRSFLTLTRSRLFMGANCLVKEVRRVQAGDFRAHWLSNNYGDLVEEWVGGCVRSGVKVLLVPELLADSPPPSREMFKDVFEKYRGRGVYFLDLAETFGGPDSAGKYFVDNVHMNDSGYGLLAEEIARFILERDLLDARAGGQ